jgi:predicted Zn-ribbon and HTH transcriptional regulator
MACSKCRYGWQSRRERAPARCPRCSSNRIRQELG